MSAERGSFDQSTGYRLPEQAPQPEAENYPTLVQTPMQALASWRNAARSAQERVWAQAMSFERGHGAGIIEHELIQAQRRGVAVVKANADWYSKYAIDGTIPFLPYYSNDDRVRVTIDRAVLDRLKAGGVDTVITNDPGPVGDIVPAIAYARRNHNKSLGADDVAWLMKFNIADVDFNRLDFALEISNPAIVEALASQIYQVNEKRPQEDYTIDCDASNTLIVDTGRSFKSAIYQEATSMVRNAQQRVVYVGRVAPDDAYAKALLEKSDAGVPVTVITSSQDAYDHLFKTMQWTLRRFRSAVKKHPNVQLKQHDSSEIHGNFLIADDDVLFGTQNLLRSEYLLRTENTALHSKDPGLVAQLSHLASRIEHNVTLQELDRGILL